MVDNDGKHGMRYRSGTSDSFPQSGKYKIVVTFFNATGGRGLEVYWKNTAHGVTNRQRIPDSAFMPDSELLGDPPTPTF